MPRGSILTDVKLSKESEEIDIFVGTASHNGAWRRGECPGLKDRGTIFESCQGCDTADLFHFDAYNEGPP